MGKTQKVFFNAGEFYDYCKSTIYTRMFKKYGKKEIAEDITGDVFLRIAKHMEWFINQEGTRQMEYLNGQVAKVCSQHELAWKNQRTIEYREKYGVAEDRSIYLEEEDAKYNLRDLSDNEKRVAEKRFFQNKSVREIAKEEKISENAVSKRLERAKNKIKKNLQE